MGKKDSKKKKKHVEYVPVASCTNCKKKCCSVLTDVQKELKKERKKRQKLALKLKALQQD